MKAEGGRRKLTASSFILHPSSFNWGCWGVRGVALTYLTVMLLIPLLVIARDGFQKGVSGFWQAISSPVAWHALQLTLWTAAVMVIINTIMGTLTAYVLVRYEFPGKKLFNALIDLPLAIPTLVTGVMLVVLYGPQQVVGAWLKDTWGIDIIFAPPGIILALLFITYPFVVRAVQPVLLGLDKQQEYAAATLGAGPWTIFRRVTLPPLILPLTSGALLSFARAIGEFGSIVIVAGNIPFYSQTAAVYVFGEVESENRMGASAVSIVMLAIAFSLILLVSHLQQRGRKN
ncbi:MAG: sulfate ABC transporter permease subunit CysT [Anaerolineae bacterium]|nr:sulfate ABC transporter permease subunit CysT [Anaerolineales bacterium]MCQ3977261.1 sulfate ABC transporter permease subunit CysT [Anaerolineae bacterium]